MWSNQGRRRSTSISEAEVALIFKDRVLQLESLRQYQARGLDDRFRWQLCGGSDLPRSHDLDHLKLQYRLRKYRRSVTKSGVLSTGFSVIAKPRIRVIPDGKADRSLAHMN